jgi:DNA polymerase-1
MTDVLLIDGNNIGHRAWHVANVTQGDPGDAPWRAEDAREVQQRATHLFESMIWRSMRSYPLRYAAVAFDSPDCFRKALYPAYKQQPDKKERPSQLTDWLASLAARDLIAGAWVVTAPRNEADDVIATLVGQRHSRERVVVVTSDKDAYALVSDDVTILSPEGNAIDADAVFGKMGVPPAGVRMYKALVGDPSDNIGGVPGIGPVKGRQLVNDPAVRSIEHALLRIRDYHPKWVTKAVAVDDALAAGRLAYTVVGLNHNAPTTRHLHDCAVGGRVVTA